MDNLIPRRAVAGWSTMVAAVLVAGCASTVPAPVVHRAPPPAVPPPAPVVVVPAQPVPGMPAPGQPGVGMPGGVAGGVETAPIRSGSVEASGGGSAAAANPNLRTGPVGFKRPYGQVAMIDPRTPVVATSGGTPAGGVAVSSAGSAVGSAANPASAGGNPPRSLPPVAVAPSTLPSAPAVTTPSTRVLNGSGNGVVDGVRFGWPSTGGVLQSFEDTSQKGLAFAGKQGESVLAAADGRVIFSGAGPRGYGNLVIVKHNNDLLSVYAHNRSLAVKEGDAVRRGQKIAELGDTGSDRPKLHFEIRQQGKPIDPLGVLPKR